VNDRKGGDFYAVSMPFTTNQKEQTMKTRAISTYLRLVSVLALVIAIASLLGWFRSGS